MRAEYSFAVGHGSGATAMTAPSNSKLATGQGIKQVLAPVERAGVCATAEIHVFTL